MLCPLRQSPSSLVQLVILLITKSILMLSLFLFKCFLKLEAIWVGITYAFKSPSKERQNTWTVRMLISDAATYKEFRKSLKMGFLLKPSQELCRRGLCLITRSKLKCIISASKHHFTLCNIFPGHVLFWIRRVFGLRHCRYFFQWFHLKAEMIPNTTLQSFILN